MRRTLALAALGTVLLLSGCQTGPRPTLQPPTPVDDTNVSPLVDDLTAARIGTFTAEYDITPTTTGTTTRATVVNDGGAYRVVIGDIGYTTDGSTAQTCTSSSCESGLNDAYVSDLNITHRFWSSSFESRLRTDSQRNVSPTTATTETIAGQQARCVAIPLVGGTVNYCTLPGGPLARYDGADTKIELVSYTPTATAATAGG